MSANISTVPVSMVSNDWARHIVTDPARALITPLSVREHAWAVLLAARKSASRRPVECRDPAPDGGQAA